MWDYREIVQIARDGLERHSRAGMEEQSVYGLDALSEVELHPLLATAFQGARLGVRREWPYPGVVEKRQKFAARSRCDLVLTGEGEELLDPVAELLETDKATGTLFEAARDVRDTGPVGTRADPRRSAADALWLEVKVVGQYTYTLGVPGPNRAYGSELTGSLAIDLAKIAADSSLRWAGLLLVLFTDEKETADHDLMVALHRALDRGLTFSSPLVEAFDVPDRIGNRVCSVALVPR